MRALLTRLGLPARSAPGSEGRPPELHLRREIVASQADSPERGVRSKCVGPAGSFITLNPLSGVAPRSTLLTRRDLHQAPLPWGYGVSVKRVWGHRCYVNGVATSLRVLRELGGALVDFNGQHAAQGLREAGVQLALLDALARTGGAAEAFGVKLGALRDAHARLAAIDALGREAQRARLQALVDQASTDPSRIPLLNIQQ